VYIFIVGMTLLKAVQFEMIQAHGVDSSAPQADVYCDFQVIFMHTQTGQVS